MSTPLSTSAGSKWIASPQRIEALQANDKVITAIKRKLTTENGIDLPFPTQQILFHDQTEETDGDRARQREGWPAGGGIAPHPRTVAGALRQLAGLGRGDPAGSRPPAEGG